METPEIKPINAQLLADGGLDSIFDKLVRSGTPLKKPDAFSDTRKLPQSWLTVFKYIEEHVDKSACVTEEQQQAIADRIIKLSKGGVVDFEAMQGLVKLIDSYRVECANCINRTCAKRNPFLNM